MTGAALTLEICAGPLLSRPVRYGCAGLSFICSMTGCAMSEQSSEAGLTSNRNADSAPTPQDPTGAGTVSPEKPKASRATKVAAWSGGPSDPGRRPLVRHSLGPDDAQHGFDRRRLREQSRDVRRRPRPGPSRARPRRRQLPGAQGRPSGRTGQGAVSDRSRDQKGGCRYGDGRPTSGQVQSARHRSGGHEPAPGAGARHGGRRRPGRPAARQGCRCRQEQSRARAGSA